MRRSMIGAVLLCLLGAVPLGAQAGDESVKAFEARAVPQEAPSIDGALDDNAWRQAAWRSDFLQKVPVEGGTPTGRTEVAFLYDEHALYVAARMASADPAGIPTTVTRRDQFSNAEHLVISLDTYRDRRTAYSFIVSSGGVRADYFHPSDSEDSREMAWDPVWEARVRTDSTGWTAEVRIPFSQLRFAAAGAQDWGVQINRWMPHVNEDVYWVVIPARETGWASRFGALTGITGVTPPRRIELTPYVAGSATFQDVAAGNPFEDGSDFVGRAGADLKLGLGPNLTLDATVNPDFGQVEADPAEVNLTAFETFFSERRPFFTEGSRLLSGGGANFFYSRRIGQSPRGRAEGDFVDRPLNTTILGAAKVTGRMGNGLSVGALTALTGREEARTYDAGGGTFGSTPIEPLTGYGVGRLQQEFGPNASTAGATFTAVRRDMDAGSPLGALLPRTAIAGGTDVNLRTAGGAYEFGANVGFSHVAGDPDAIARVQLHPAHFAQRPDATEISFDPTRTSLFGWTAGLSAEKNSGRHWVGSVHLGAESPYFDINDAGQLGQANDLGFDSFLQYRQTEPRGIFQRHNHNLSVGRQWNFGGVHNGTYMSLGNNFTFRNFMYLFLGSYVELAALSDNLTRGGPLMATPFVQGFDAMLMGNEGKPVQWRGSVNYEYDQLGGDRWQLRGGFSVRPAPRWRLSVDPTYVRSTVSQQYVTALDGGGEATYGRRYVFAFVDRSTLSAQMRLNYAFSPDLTLELYAEPFVATGSFREFGELEAARTSDILVYGEDGTTITPSDDGYEVTAGGDTFTLPNPDFSVLSFRSNLVLRWEWLRGSTLFLVWQQDRSGPTLLDRGAGVRSLFDTFRAPGSNFLALKATYWLAPG